LPQRVTVNKTFNNLVAGAVMIADVCVTLHY